LVFYFVALLGFIPGKEITLRNNVPFTFLAHPTARDEAWGDCIRQTESQQVKEVKNVPPDPTLRNWEQGRRKPEGPARVLLRVAAEHPEAILGSPTHRKAPKRA
jgi:hypothetical protein